MRYLLDTHIWLWLLESPTKIASPVRATLDAADELVLSVASVWEIAIKVKLGKLVVRPGVDAARQEMLTAIGARELVITSEHALAGDNAPSEVEGLTARRTLVVEQRDAHTRPLRSTRVTRRTSGAAR